MTHPLANFARNLDQLNLLITDIIKFININIILFYFNYSGPEIPCLRIIKK
jgi:hypothetical protein